MQTKRQVCNADEYKEELDARLKNIMEMDNTVVSWFCNDNNRVMHKLINNLDKNDVRNLNDRLSKLSNIVVNEVVKMSEEYKIFFWDIYDCMVNNLLLCRLPVVHTEPDVIIPDDYKEWKATEARNKERVEKEREMLKSAKAIRNDKESNKKGE